MRRTLRSLPCLLLSAHVAACGGDTAGPGDVGGLDLVESATVLDAFLRNVAYALQFLDLQDGPSQRTINRTVPCFLSGSIVVFGTVGGIPRPDGTGGTISMDIRQSIRDCRIERALERLVVNGSPFVRSTGTVTVTTSGSTVRLDGAIHMTGGFTYIAADDRAGSCGVDMRLSYQGTGGRVTGAICGNRVNEAF